MQPRGDADAWKGAEDSAAALSAGTIAPESGRGASLAIRLSAAIVTATVDEPRVLTVRIGQEPIEALPSGPLEVEHRTLEVGLRAWVERQTEPAARLCRAALHLRRPRPRRDRRGSARPRPDGRLSGAGARGAAGPERPRRFGRTGTAFFRGRIGVPASRRRSPRSRSVSANGPGRPRPRPSGGCARSGSASPSPPPGTRSWCSSATSCSTRRA